MHDIKIFQEKLLFPIQCFVLISPNLSAFKLFSKWSNNKITFLWDYEGRVHDRTFSDPTKIPFSIATFWQWQGLFHSNENIELLRFHSHLRLLKCQCAKRKFLSRRSSQESPLSDVSCSRISACSLPLSYTSDICDRYLFGLLCRVNYNDSQRRYFVMDDGRFTRWSWINYKLWINFI